MSPEDKSALLGLGLALLTFGLLQRSILKDKTPDPVKQPTITDANIQTAITAYANAVNAGENDSLLNDLNDGFVEEYGFRVSLGQDNRFTIYDLSGKSVKVV